VEYIVDVFIRQELSNDTLVVYAVKVDVVILDELEILLVDRLTIFPCEEFNVDVFVVEPFHADIFNVLK